MEFRVIKKSKKSGARLGVLKTSHGEVETPAFVPVATQAVVKTLESSEVLETGSQILISNTFHLHIKPSEKFVAAAGGLHKFMNWQRPIMTDSAGFQIFSLGFGRDYGVGKILKEKRKSHNSVQASQPRNIKITNDGVYFRSPVDGVKLFIGPKESIAIQEKLGADIMFAFDEPTSPLHDEKYVASAVGRTHKWAEVCIKAKRTNQSLFGIVQGSNFRKLREESAKFINGLDFDGFGIGGDYGEDKTFGVLKWVTPHLDERKPRHLLGIGYLNDMENIVKRGMDTFDCIVPTHYGRRGFAFTSSGQLDLRNKKFLSDPKPLDPRCDCRVCLNYRRNYIAHLLRAGEITALKFLTFHNLYYFNGYVEKIREKIMRGKV